MVSTSTAQTQSSTTMAKKRKAAARSQEPAAVSELDPRDSRKRIRTYEDVADSDDEFHLNHDKIRLDEAPDAKRRRKWAEQEEFLQASDEEVLGYSEIEEEASDLEDAPATRNKPQLREQSGDEDDARSDANGDEDLGWGTSRADLYGTDAIETEEQALEEEAEALRLQKKQLEAMQTADYGFDDDDWQQGDSGDVAKSGHDGAVVTETLPTLQIAPDLGPADRLKLLKSRYPEFELLSKDLLNLREAHSALVETSEPSPVARMKIRAAAAYIGALVMYFSLFTSPASGGKIGTTALPAVQLRDHPVMDSLFKCRELWTNVQTLDSAIVADAEDVSMSSGEESGIPAVAQDMIEVETRRPKKMSRAERFAHATHAAASQRKADRLQRTEAGLADLDSLIAPSSKRHVTGSSAVGKFVTRDDSDLGEEAPLTAREAEEKAKRKKSLRFYTSQIAQKANKRGAAGRNAGGDDDIPYRERLKDRQARLNAEAAKRGQRGGDIGDDLGGASDEDDRRQARQIRADADEDDYYDLVAARAAKKKGDKAALADAQKEAALHGGRVVEEATVGPDGKRKISYLIEKNKGLTPHRKKDVRNPRVKKRKKYDEKKKKLASIKPVYKGGEGRGGYGGELTGIKKGLVKSTKL